MKTNNLWTGIFVTAAVLLFGAGLFLIGNQHKAFRKHTTFYTDIANVDGISKGAKVRVNGMDAGQVDEVIVPDSPAHKFRLKLTLDDRLRGLIRTDSMVSVETEGLVGDKFLLVRSGSDRSPEAQAGATLRSKEPFEIGKMLEQANGLLTQVSGTVTQVNGTIADVQGRLDGTLETVNATVRNADGVVTDIRHGKGAAGVLLEDPKTAAEVQQVVVNTRDATESLDATVKQVHGMVQDVQQRQLIAKVDDTLNSAKSASQQLDQASQQMNKTLTSAFAQDQYGQDAGANLQQSLSNITIATGNLSDDTEALKHEFFFKGFFKKRGYDNLDQLPVGPYRSGKILSKLSKQRQWIAASSLFEENGDGTERLTAMGRQQLDDAVGHMDGLYDSPLIIEGYDATGRSSQMLVRSRQRAVLVRGYLQTRYHLAAKNTGVIGLSATPPNDAGRSTWDGVCLVHLSQPK